MLAATLAAAAAALAGCTLAPQPPVTPDPPETGCAHTFMAVSHTAGSCTEDDVTTFRCTRCGETTESVTHASGHRYSDWTLAMPTRDPNADHESRTCSVCGSVETRPLTEKGGGDETVLASLAVMPAGGGTYYDNNDDAANRLRSLIGLYQTRRGTLNPAEVALLEEEVRAARANLSYITSDIPLVFITTAKTPGTEYREAELVFVDTDGTVVWSEETGQIRTHGNSTSWSKKKSYNVKLSQKANLFDVETARKWVLIGNQYDVTRIRNAVAYSLADRLGLPYTPAYTYVDAYVNGEYWGEYMLVEKIDVSETSVDIDPDAGDFLFEVENWRPKEGVTFITTKKLNLRVGLNAPEVPTDDQLTAITATLNTFDKALSAGVWADVAALCDVDSFVNYYLFHEFVKDLDVSISSTRFFCKGGIMYAGPAWDFDLSMGNAHPDDRPAYFNYDKDGVTGIWAGQQNKWFRAFVKYDEFMALVKARYAEVAPLIRSVYDENAEGGALIDILADAYRPSFERTSKIAGCKFYRYSALEREPEKNYDGNLEYLRKWLRLRDEWLRGTWGIGG